MHVLLSPDHQGLTTACCENCPTGARQLVDLRIPRIRFTSFFEDNKVQVLKPHWRPEPKCFTSGLGRRRCDKEELMHASRRRRLHVSERGGAAVERADRALSVPDGTGGGGVYSGSLERVFKVEAVKPTYRLALLTALAFLLVAPLPLQLHLGHPERSFEMYLTPHTSSAMAMFGFVYLWYLMVVLLLEIWLDYRRDIVPAAQIARRAVSGCL